MNRVLAILSGIQAQLGRLSVTQKLLIASLCVLFLMTLFLLTQYAAAPATLALLPTGTSDDQQKAAAFLNNKGIPFKVAPDGKIMVQPEQRYVALAAMTKEQALPGDKKLMFESVVTKANWLEPLADKQAKHTIALQNELAMVIRHIPGIEGASVFISRPPDNGGIGAAAKKTVAQLTVFPIGGGSGQGLDQPTVNMLADFVAGSVSGLDVGNVAIIDGKARRSYRAVSADDLAIGGSYIEQVAKVEKRIQDKLVEHLRFIPDAIVSVNAIVDAARRDFKEIRVLPKGNGSENMTKSETTTTDTSNSGGRSPGEPGVGSNIAMDINRGSGSSSTTTSKESTTTEFSPEYGSRTTSQRDPAGRPTKINVTVSVPREYVAAIIKQRKAAPATTTPATAAAIPEPSDEEIAAAFDSTVKPAIEGMIAPLVETDGASGGGGATGASVAGQLVTGTVKAFLIPVAMVSAGSGLPGSNSAGMGLGGSGAGGAGIAAMFDTGLVKTISLGLLAFLAVGMMFMMVRKAGKAQDMPTAEELVGIPPALEPGSDVVGEAVEGDTAMPGIEIDSDSLRTSKMLEEIGTLVKSNPQTAANVFNRWLTEEE